MFVFDDDDDDDDDDDEDDDDDDEALRQRPHQVFGPLSCDHSL